MISLKQLFAHLLACSNGTVYLSDFVMNLAQRLLERSFGVQKYNYLLLYLDDVIVFSSTVDEQMQNLRVVLKWLKQ